MGRELASPLCAQRAARAQSWGRPARVARRVGAPESGARSNICQRSWRARVGAIPSTAPVMNSRDAGRHLFLGTARADQRRRAHVGLWVPTLTPSSARHRVRFCWLRNVYLGTQHIVLTHGSSAREGTAPTRARQSVPPAIRRQILLRDQKNCQVPGCRNGLACASGRDGVCYAPCNTARRAVEIHCGRHSGWPGFVLAPSKRGKKKLPPAAPELQKNVPASKLRRPSPWMRRSTSLPPIRSHSIG
jgi:hypothetical protein